MWDPIVQAMAAFKSSNVEEKLGREGVSAEPCLPIILGPLLDF